MEYGDAPVKSVQKALALLDRLALGDLARRGVALSELAQEFGLPLNTAHNLLKSLVACGYVAMSGRGVYLAGPKCAQLSRVAQCAETDFQGRVLTELQRFVDAEGEACLCVILVEGERVKVGAVDSTRAVRVAHATVENEPFFARPSGRLLAAMADEAELQQILARQGMPGADWDGITADAALRQALAAVRAQGWCLINGPELIGLSCPILNADGRTWGALGTFAPAYRCAEERQHQLLAGLQRAAAVLGREIS
jgi:IclR family pca regulon transcriptional regulator